MELNYKICALVHAINFPENAMWIGFVSRVLVYGKQKIRLIKTTIKTALQSDNKPIYGYSSKIINNSVTITATMASTSTIPTIKTAAKITTTATATTTNERARVAGCLTQHNHQR